MPALGAEIAKTFRRLRPGNVWLGWQDSNLRMTESKSVALPLGDIPMYAASEQGHLTDETRMGWMKGFEPSTPGTTIRCSNQLSYTHHTASAQWQRPQPLTQEKPSLPACGPDASPLNGTGTPEGTRTPGPLLRRQLLYPPELQAHVERVMGIEPTRPAWKAGVLPLNYTRRGFF